MRNHILASMMLIASTSFAFAADEDLSKKVMKDQPGVTGPGTTADPTAKPADSSPSQKQMKDAQGVQSNTGTTAEPTAKPDDSSVSQKQMKDAPGVN